MEDKFGLETGQFGTRTLSVQSRAVRVRAQSGLASSHKVSKPCDTRTYPSLSISCSLTASETVWAVAFLDFIRVYICWVCRVCRCRGELCAPVMVFRGVSETAANLSGHIILNSNPQISFSETFTFNTRSCLPHY